MKKQKYILSLLSIITILLLSCNKDDDNTDNTAFSNEQKVEIIGYSSDAMEPFITKDNRYLFFNNLQGPNNKDLFYAERINDSTFNFKGEIIGVNSPYVDANPTMDEHNNFYFISTRSLDSVQKTIFCGYFEDGIVSNVHLIEGSINIDKPYWINMGVEISKTGEQMFVSNALFDSGNIVPTKGDIHFAEKSGDTYNIPDNEEVILSNINTEDAIEYAGEISSDGLELFYSQVSLTSPPVFKLFYAKRNTVNEKFEVPQSIDAPFKNNVNAIVEAPSLSNDKKILYYHKYDGNKYSIYMITKE